MIAIHYGEVCSVVGEELTESILVPVFGDLCKDGVWGIRKACAEVFVTVSCVCSMPVRKTRLAELFVLLLMDSSRWVRLAAFQALGAFISTFADPNSPFILYDEDGTIHIKTPDTAEEDDDSVQEENDDSGFGSQEASNVGSPLSDDLEDDIERRADINYEWQINSESESAQLTEITQRLTLQEDEEDCYNSFQFWREPITEVKVLKLFYSDRKQVDKSNYFDYLNVGVVSDFEDDGFLFHNEIMDDLHNDGREYASFGLDVSCNQINANNLLTCYRSSQEFETIAPSTMKEIVPANLLYHYLDMTNPELLQALDNELVRYCAYSFPAVILTLGRQHWSLFRDLYKRLASDMQWKVRRTLAFSIHELAAILGKDLAAKDLVPIFDSFIRDLDEVRIGILKHLSEFITRLPADARLAYLDKYCEFLEPENDRNWRFRYELSQQISLVCHFYTPENVAFYLIPIAVRLLQDRVAEVRSYTVKTLAILIDTLVKPKTKPVNKKARVVIESKKTVEELLHQYSL